jgi:serine/threonine protein phosphatase 1
MKKDLWAIGDIHGCFDELQTLLDQIETKSPNGAEVVFLADYIDRGPKSSEVVRFLMGEPRRPQDIYVKLRGNHEQLLLKAIAPNSTLDEIDHWLDNGGDATINSFFGHDYTVSWPTLYREPFWYQKANKYGGYDPDPSIVRASIPADVVAWLNKLPYYHQTENHLFAHAGAQKGVKAEDQDPYHLMWMRKWELADQYRLHGVMYATEQSPDWEWHVVYGHTPRKEPYLLRHCSGLDTGAVYGNGLTAGKFDRKAKMSGPIEIVTIPTRKYT